MARPAASKIIFNRFIKLFNYPVTFVNKYRNANFRIPGMHYDDFDRAGYVNLYKLSRLFETARGLNMKYVYSVDHETKGELLVGLSSYMDISESFYARAAMDFPMEYKMDTIAMKRSSLVREHTLAEESTGDVMATFKALLVNINNETRTSCPLSQHMIEKYNGPIDVDPRSVFPSIKNETAPQNAFVCSIEVQHSDMDLFFHTNMNSYIAFVLNATSKAAKDNIFSKIKGDICYYKAKTAAWSTKVETFAGDLLTVYVWEDHMNPWKMHSEIKKDNDIVFYTAIDFYPERNL